MKEIGLNAHFEVLSTRRRRTSSRLLLRIVQIDMQIYITVSLYVIILKNYTVLNTK